MSAQLAPRSSDVSSLNDAQRRAAEFGRDLRSGRFNCGPLLIIAGAGTGKTNTLAHRVANLVLSGIPAERVLLLTFSRRAAQEMIRRTQTIVSQALNGSERSNSNPARVAQRFAWAGTFHSVAHRLLRQHAQQLGLAETCSVMDRGDAADLMDFARQELALAQQDKRFPRKDTCLSIYSLRVNTQQPLAAILQEQFPWCVQWCEELAQLFRGYVQSKQRLQVLDYDDLLLYWHVLMREPALAAAVSERFDHVLVDEYQDTNTLQADILLALRPDGRGFCVVGDDAQAIYSFRAATVENILQFPDRFTPRAEVIALERNYRSVQPILDAANMLLAQSSRQYQKRLYSNRPSAQRPIHVAVADDQAQAGYVVEKILAAREQAVLLRQQCVLMRNSHHSDVLELELVRRNIPYVKYGGLKFLEAAHVKDTLAVLRWAANPRHRLAAFRVLQLLPGIGPAHADRCLKGFEASGYAWPAVAQYPVPAAAEKDWAALVALVQQLSAPAAPWAGQMVRVRAWFEPHLARIYAAAAVRVGDLDQLERIASQFATRDEFLTEFTLDPPQATSDLSGPAHLDEDYLILSTIHSAKGQEWNNVYVLNVSDGTIPSEFATGKPESIEEERRLLYVAMTRAKQELHLITPLKYYITQQSRKGDAHVYGARSRFLTEQVLACFEQIGWPAVVAGIAATANAQLPRIDAAARIRDMW